MKGQRQFQRPDVMCQPSNRNEAQLGAVRVDVTVFAVNACDRIEGPPASGQTAERSAVLHT